MKNFARILVLMIMALTLPFVLAAQEQAQGQAQAQEQIRTQNGAIFPDAGTGVNAGTEANPENPRKKVAVVLSGGGAKGVAHIGALRVLEEAGIPIDIVVGTSMGSIVGGLYSIGYTPRQLDSMVMAQDWGLLLSDRTQRRYQPYSQKEKDDKYQITFQFGKKIEGPGGLIRGTNLEMLFNDLMVGYHDTISFKALPKPFACVATDIVTGTEVVFYEGALPAALRASMAIPGAFTPVYTKDQVLVDGGMINNFPTDIALAMGADIVIGVDVQAPLRTKDELVGAQAVLGQLVEIAMGQQTWKRNVSLADVYIPVDVKGYTSASFNLPALDTLIRRGAEAATAKLDELELLKEKIGIPADFVPEPNGPYLELSKRGNFHIYNVSFEGLKPREQKWVMRKCRIAKDSEADMESLNRSMEILGATSLYSNIYYSLRDTLDGYNLDFHMQAMKGNSLSAGIEADTEEIAAALLNGTFRFGKQVPMELSVTGRLGKRLMAQIDFTFLTSPLSGFKFGYTFRHNDIDVNLSGGRDFNLTYNHHLASFSFVNMNFLRQNLRLEAGIVYQNYFFHRRLVESQPVIRRESPLTITDEQFVSYFGRIDYETIDSRLFTQRGTALSAHYQLYTDNFYQYKGDFPFSALSLSWMTAFPLSKRFSLIPSLYGRVLFGHNIPFPMANVVGGKFFGRYMPQQMPFDGIGFMELAPHSFLAAKLQARERIGRRHFVSASFNYGIADNSMLDIFKTGKHYFGASIDYGYNFRIIPVMASFTWSNITHSLGFYAQVGYMF